MQTTLQEGCKPSKGSAQKERAAAMQPSLARMAEATVLVFDDEEDALTTKYPSSKKEQTEVVSEFLSARKLLKISNVFPTTFSEDISKAIRATGRLSGAFAFATAGRNPNGKKPSKVFVQSSYYGSDRQLTADELRLLKVFIGISVENVFAIVLLSSHLRTETSTSDRGLQIYKNLSTKLVKRRVQSPEGK